MGPVFVFVAVVQVMPYSGGYEILPERPSSLEMSSSKLDGKSAKGAVSSRVTFRRHNTACVKPH
jgi:hypothetical protein